MRPKPPSKTKHLRKRKKPTRLVQHIIESSDLSSGDESHATATHKMKKIRKHSDEPGETKRAKKRKKKEKKKVHSDKSSGDSDKEVEHRSIKKRKKDVPSKLYSILCMYKAQDVFNVRGM